MSKFTHHIFVCGNQRSPGHRRGCCDPTGSGKLRSALKTELKKRGLKGEVRANSAGCLDQCEQGPVIVIYPQAIWYGNVQLTDAARIVEKTIMAGEIIEDLLIPQRLLDCPSAEVTPSRSTEE